MQSTEDRRELYRLMVRQLLYDGFAEAAHTLSESTLTAVSEVDAEGDTLAKLIAAAEEENTDEKDRRVKMESWNKVYNYFGHGEQLMTRYVGTQTKETRCLGWSQDGRYLASGDSGGKVTLHLVQKMMENKGEARTPSSTALARVYDDNSQSVEAVAFHPSNPVVIAGSRDGHIKLFHYTRPRTKKPSVVLRDEFAIRSMAVHQMGQHMLAGTEHSVVRLWDLEAETVFRAPDDICDMRNTSAGMVNCVDWAPDGRCFASGSSDGTLKLWDPSQPVWQVVPINFCHSGAEVTSVQFSQTGRQILTAGKDGCIRLFDTRTYKCVACHGKPKQTKSRLLAAFTAHEECVMAVEKDRLRLIDRTNMKDNMELLQGQTLYNYQEIKAFAPSPAAPFVATGDDGFKIRLWTPGDDVEDFHVEIRKGEEEAGAAASYRNVAPPPLPEAFDSSAPNRPTLT